MITLTTRRFASTACITTFVVLVLTGVPHAGTSLECTIDSAQNVPPNPVPGIGSGSFVLNDAQTELAYHIEFSGLLSPEVAAHFHNGGFHSNGPALFGLSLGSPKIGVWPISPTEVVELLAGRIYVNIHSEVYILGELRGNLAVVTSGVDPPVTTPGATDLQPNYPNPFNPRTTIEYSIAARTHMSLKIYDTSGRLIRTLVDRTHSPSDSNTVEWNGLDDSGSPVATGVYFYRLETVDFSQTRKMVLVK